MKNKLILIGAILLTATALSISIYAVNGQKKMAYFDYNKVYNDCELKKELEEDLEKVVSLRKSQLDSMQLELTLLSERIKSHDTNQDELNHFEDLKTRFLTYQNQYEQENVRLKEEYFTQIRTSINDKSKEYAEKYGYDYFFSAVGDGSLMYAQDTEDVTEDFMSYVND